MTEGVWGGGGQWWKMGGVRWAGSGATGCEVQISRGVQVRWAGGSGQLGRVGSQVMWGLGGQEGNTWDWLRSWVPRVGGYLAPSYLSSLSPKPHPLCPFPHCCLQQTYTGSKNCFDQIHFQIGLNVFIDNITTHIWLSWHYHDMCGLHCTA